MKTTVKLLFGIFAIAFISCGSSQNITQINSNMDLHRPQQAGEVFYVDYDNFTDTLLTKRKKEYIRNKKVKNFIRVTSDINADTIKREWYYKNKLRMVEVFSNNVLVEQTLISNNIVKRKFHYIDKKIFRINIYLNGKLNAKIKYFYNNKGLVYKFQKLDSKKIIKTIAYLKYNARNQLLTLKEYSINYKTKAKSLLRFYKAEYENNKISYDIEYLYDKKGKQKHFERYYNKGSLRVAMMYSSNIRGKILYMNKYRGNKIIYSEAYYPGGKVKTRVSYKNNTIKAKLGYSNNGRLLYENRFNENNLISLRN